MLTFVETFLPGAVAVGSVWFGVLVAKHGWGWVLAKFKAWRAGVNAKASAPLTQLQQDITAIKTKIGA